MVLLFLIYLILAILIVLIITYFIYKNRIHFNFSISIQSDLKNKDKELTKNKESVGVSS